MKNFTVVADAAMIISENVQQLKQTNINFIVGARLGNLSKPLLKSIDQNIIREDDDIIRIKTLNGDLDCRYS